MPMSTSRRRFIATSAKGLGAAVAAGATSAVASAHESRHRKRERVFLFVADVEIDGNDPAAFVVPDPQSEFLIRSILRGNDTFESLNVQAEAFLLERFGFDFRSVPADANGMKFLPGLLYMPFQTNPEVNYSAMDLTRDGQILHATRFKDAGFMAMVTGPGVTYHGEFGGAAGKPATPGDVMPWGYYGVPGLGERGRQLTIHYGAKEPMRGNADGNIAVACELRESPFGQGLAYGIAKFTPRTPGRVHVFVRNVLTFPGNLTTL